MNFYKAKVGQKCVCCLDNAVDLHHVVSRAAGGSDNAYNLAPLCRKHHQEIHQIGRTSMANKYSSFKMFLISHKWELCELTRKWVHYNEN